MELVTLSNVVAVDALAQVQRGIVPKLNAVLHVLPLVIRIIPLTMGSAIHTKAIANTF